MHSNDAVVALGAVTVVVAGQSLLFAAGPGVYEENELELHLDAVLVVVQHELTAGMRGGC